MCGIIGSMIVGAFVAGRASKISWRPVVRGGIREAVRAQHKLAELSARVRTEVNQLVAEALDELDRSEQASGSSSSSNL